jgi:hypothetical protein
LRRDREQVITWSHRKGRTQNNTPQKCSSLLTRGLSFCDAGSASQHFTALAYCTNYFAITQHWRQDICFLFSAYKFNRLAQQLGSPTLSLSDPNLGATPFSFVCTGVKYHDNFFVLCQNRDRLTQDAGRTEKKIRSIVFRRQRFLSWSADCSGKKVNDIIPTV